MKMRGYRDTVVEIHHEGEMWKKANASLNSAFNSRLKGVNEEEHDRCMLWGQVIQVHSSNVWTAGRDHNMQRHKHKCVHTFKDDLWGSKEQLEIRHWTPYDRSVGMSLWLLLKAHCSYHNSEWWRVWPEGQCACVCTVLYVCVACLWIMAVNVHEWIFGLKLNNVQK